jgi:hypothetical protein
MKPFISDYIQIDEKGIDLLRSRFAYKHLDYSEIRSLKIRKGYLLKNRIVPLIVGLIFLSISIQLLIQVFPTYKNYPFGENLYSYQHIKGLVWVFVLPFILAAVGIYFIIQSFRVSKILMIETFTDKYNIRLKEFEKDGTIQEITDFLKIVKPDRLNINDY